MFCTNRCWNDLALKIFWREKAWIYHHQAGRDLKQNGTGKFHNIYFNLSQIPEMARILNRFSTTFNLAWAHNATNIIYKANLITYKTIKKKKAKFKFSCFKLVPICCLAVCVLQNKQKAQLEMLIGHGTLCNVLKFIFNTGVALKWLFVTSAVSSADAPVNGKARTLRFIFLREINKLTWVRIDIMWRP